MKPKNNSKTRCSMCFGYYKFNKYNFYSENICMACHEEHLIGRLLIRFKWNKIPKHIINSIELRQKELKR
jgi:hypothetical protein